MNILPLEIALSYKQTNRFSSIKSRTGITPNIMARIAILKALEDNIEPEKLEKATNLSQKIPSHIAFGDFIDLFDFAISHYTKKYSYSGDVRELISNLIETGAHKIGNIKNITDFRDNI